MKKEIEGRNTTAFEDLTSDGFSEYRPDFEEMSASSESNLYDT